MSSVPTYVISHHYPPDMRQALLQALDWPTAAQRIARIDQLTDELARRGLARGRDDGSMAPVWDAMRTVAQLATGAIAGRGA